MIETRELTPAERRWVRNALRLGTAPQLTDRTSLWTLALHVAVGIGVARFLQETVFHHLMPDRPTLGFALSIAAGAGLAVAASLSAHWLRGKLAGQFTPFQPKLEQDARDAVAEVHTSNDVDSWFDLEQDSRCRDLVVRFPEGEIRVDSATCEQESISEPVSGWCRITRLPRTGLVLDMTTKRP